MIFLGHETIKNFRVNCLLFFLFCSMSHNSFGIQRDLGSRRLETRQLGALIATTLKTLSFLHADSLGSSDDICKKKKAAIAKLFANFACVASERFNIYVSEYLNYVIEGQLIVRGFKNIVEYITLLKLEKRMKNGKDVSSELDSYYINFSQDEAIKSKKRRKVIRFVELFFSIASIFMAYCAYKVGKISFFMLFS